MCIGHHHKSEIEKDISSRELVSRMYKELFKFNNKKTYNPHLYGKNI